MGSEFLLTLLFSLFAFQFDTDIMAQETSRIPVPIFVPTTEADLWGLIDHDGRLVVPPKYSAIWGFRKVPDGNAIALVMGTDSKFGYIDTTGREVHPTTLEDAFQFSEDGLALFKQNGKFGFIGTDGKPAIPVQYSDAKSMSYQRALVTANGKGSYIDKTGHVVIPGPFAAAEPFGRNGLAAVAVAKKPRAWGYIDTDGKWVIKPAFDRTTEFSEDGRAAVATFAKQGLNPFAKPEWRWGVIDETGKWIVEPKYDSLDAFDSRGLAVFTPVDEDESTRKCGVLNDRGEELFLRDNSYLEIEAHCDLIRPEYSLIRTPYDLKGNPVEALSNRTFNWIGHFDDAKQAVALRDDKWGRVSSDGQFKPWPDVVQEPCVDYYADDYTPIINADGQDGDLIPVVMTGGRLGYVNSDNHLAYLTDFEGSPEADTLVFKRSDGTEIWRHRFENTKLVRCRSFFLPSDKETGFKAEYLTNIEKSVNKLVAAKPTWFEFSISTRDTSEAYEVAEDDREDASYGAINILGNHYVNKHNLSFYGDFLAANHKLWDHLKSVKKQLIAKYGKPLDLANDEDQHVKKIRDLEGYIMSDASYWDLGEGYLQLSVLSNSAADDFGTTLTLAYLFKKRSE